MAEPIITSYSELPIELLIKLFFELPYTEFPKLSCVCSSWNSHLSEKIWKPLQEIKFPLPVQPQGDGKTPPSMRVIAATLLQDNQSNIDCIVDQIKDDEELSKCLGTETYTLDEFKNFSPFERSRILWKAMFKDATPVLVKLIEGYQSGHMAYLKQCKQSTNWDGNQVRSEYNKIDRSSSVVNSLISTHKVPYDKAEIVYALMQDYRVIPHAESLIINIVKSHEDLSKLWERTFPNRMGNVANSVVCLCLTGSNGAVTRNDLILCQLFSGVVLG